MIPPVPEFLTRQLDLVDRWHQAPYEVSENRDFESLLDRQHWANFSLWHEEDLARDPDATDRIIAQVKRNIDKLNQQRNDLIEQLDEYLLGHSAASCQTIYQTHPSTVKPQAALLIGCPSVH